MTPVGRVLAFGIVAAAAAGGLALYVHRDAPPACDSEQALHGVSDILRDQFHLDSLFVNNIATVSGGWFSDRHECSAEVASIRGNVDASAMPWRSIQYQIDRRDKSRRAVISVRLGGDVPLAKPQPSLWERLLARL